MDARKSIAAFSLLLTCAAVAAESPERWQTSVSLTPVFLGSAGIDGGGSYESRGLAVNLGAVRSVSFRGTAGITVNYAYYDNRFGATGIFGPEAPWGDVERVGIGAPMFLRMDNGWTLMLTPTLDYFREDGADWGDSLAYGGVMSAARRFGPKRTLGLGLGVFQQIEEFRVFPFLVVDWQVNEQWRLNNPLAAGPTGPAGLELNYRASGQWEIGVGAAYRSVRFRLSGDGPFPDGVGEESGVVTFLHAATKLGPNAGLDLYGGVLLNGELAIEDWNGDPVVKHGLHAAPLLGAAVHLRF